MYVAESLSGRLRVFDQAGSLLRQWRSVTRAAAVDPAGYVYAIGGGARERVEKFTAAGSFVAGWEGGPDPDRGFGEPRGIAVGAAGKVYVADTFRNRIQVFAGDGSFVAALGSYGRGPGQLLFPYDVATDAAGNVYVADTANDRVQKLSAAGAFVGGWGGTGKGPGRFHSPTSIATDPAGFVYVADGKLPFLDHAGIARVQKFTPSGELVAAWLGAPALPRPARPRLFARLARTTARRAAIFRFRSRQRDVRFQCRLGGRRVQRRLRSWRPCTSPKRYARLRPGGKAFQVRALKDTEGSEPARRSWRIVGRPRSSG